jgi:hypothetical protein
MAQHGEPPDAPDGFDIWEQWYHKYGQRQPNETPEHRHKRMLKACREIYNNHAGVMAILAWLNQYEGFQFTIPDDADWDDETPPQLVWKKQKRTHAAQLRNCETQTEGNNDVYPLLAYANPFPVDEPEPTRPVPHITIPPMAPVAPLAPTAPPRRPHSVVRPAKAVQQPQPVNPTDQTDPQAQTTTRTVVFTDQTGQRTQRITISCPEPIWSLEKIWLNERNLPETDATAVTPHEFNRCNRGILTPFNTQHDQARKESKARLLYQRPVTHGWATELVLQLRLFDEHNAAGFAHMEWLAATNVEPELVLFAEQHHTYDGDFEDACRNKYPPYRLIGTHHMTRNTFVAVYPGVPTRWPLDINYSNIY